MNDLGVLPYLTAGVGALAWALAESRRKPAPGVRFQENLGYIEWFAGHLLYTEQAETKEEAFERAALRFPYCVPPRHVRHHPAHKVRT